MPAAADSALAASRLLMITDPPSATKRRATSLPIPQAPPVTIAILAWKRTSALLLPYLSIGGFWAKMLGTFPRQPLRRRPVGAPAVESRAFRVMATLESGMMLA